MRSSFMRYLLAAVLVLAALPFAGCDEIWLQAAHFTGAQTAALTADAGDIPVDTEDIVGDIALPPVECQSSWTLDDKADQATLGLEYQDISLAQVMAFLDGLEEDGWYLTDNGAYKGVHSIDIFYSMEMRLLALDCTRDKTAAEWPQNILTPYLAYRAPAFPYGEFSGYNREDETVRLAYTGVTPQEMDEYITLLENLAGGPSEANAFNMDTYFIQYAYQNGVAQLTIGPRDIAPVPLPPWPEPLPEHIQRILPPVAAVISVAGAEDGFFATAEQTTLAELHGFFSAAQSSGWSALSGQDEMLHEESGFGMRILSYGTDTQVWTLNLFDTWTGPEAPASTAPAQTDALNGITGYGFLVTKQRYSEQEAMMGVLDEFGQFADMADWSEMMALYGDDFQAFLQQAGVQHNEDVWVKYGGSRSDGNRYYFLAFIDGEPRDDFLRYDSVGDIAWLGSWHDLSLRVLVKVPSDQL